MEEFFQALVRQLGQRGVPTPGAGRRISGDAAHSLGTGAFFKHQPEFIAVVLRHSPGRLPLPALALDVDGTPGDGYSPPSGKFSRSFLTSIMKRSASAPSTMR